ncbi:MAG: MoaD/ThiS family protein [Planctomycetota bacterium]|jgi:molybdopterin converting factor small subunit|nr:MoaD/ThiS family protein [Planctomycetota bacterium]
MKILLFAGLKEAIGDQDIQIEVVGKTVQEIKTELTNCYPQAENLILRSHFAVGNDYVSDHFRFEAVPAEIAIIPPVSGG